MAYSPRWVEYTVGGVKHKAIAYSAAEEKGMLDSADRPEPPAEPVAQAAQEQAAAELAAAPSTSQAPEEIPTLEFKNSRRKKETAAPEQEVM